MCENFVLIFSYITLLILCDIFVVIYHLLCDSCALLSTYSESSGWSRNFFELSLKLKFAFESALILMSSAWQQKQRYPVVLWNYYIFEQICRLLSYPIINLLFNFIYHSLSITLLFNFLQGIQTSVYTKPSLCQLH